MTDGNANIHATVDAVPRRPRIGTGIAMIADNWLVVIALYPLIRFVLLNDTPADMSDFQYAERFFWLSCWLVECLVIAMAMTRRSILTWFARQLSPLARVAVILWLVAVVIGTATASAPDAALRSMTGWLIHAAFFAALWRLATDDPLIWRRQIERLATFLPYVTAAVGLIAMMQVYRIGLTSGFPFGYDLPGFAHLRHTGYMFAPAMALGMARIALTTDARSAWPATFLLALNAGLCLWFGSRGPFVGLAVGLVVAATLFPQFRRAAFLGLAGLALAAGAMLSLLVPSPPNAGFNAVQRLWAGSQDVGTYSSGRTELWRETAALIQDRPLFGHGGEQFQFASLSTNNILRHPHDFALQFLFDWGLIGGGAALILMTFVLMAAVRAQASGTATSRIGVFAGVSMLGFALIDGLFFYPYTIAVSAIFAVAALCPGQTPTSTRGTQARSPSEDFELKGA